MKYNELPDRDTAVGDEAGPVCRRRFEPDDEVTDCVDCETYVHIACLRTHWAQCPRRQN